MTIEDVSKAMCKNGFELVSDPDFEKFCSEASIFYYYEFGNEDDSWLYDGTTHVIVTAKSYWDCEHCVDDGSALSYTIYGAMGYCGVEEACESEYVLSNDLTIEQLVNKMRDLGFTMITDPGFTEFLDSCNS